MGTGVLPCWRVVQGVAQLDGAQGPGTTAGGLSKDVAVLGGSTVGCPCRSSEHSWMVAQLDIHAEAVPRWQAGSQCCWSCPCAAAPCLSPAHPHIPMSLVQPGSAGGDGLGPAELSPVWPQHLLFGTEKSCPNLSELK